jgi:CRP-like cAMP-binding protein
MTRNAPKNTLVALQGTAATSMYIIRRGKVQLSRSEEQGKETVIGVLSEGDCFGERALIRHKPYSETALALTDCEFSVIRREHLAFAMMNDQNLRRTIEAYINCDESEDVAYNQYDHKR